MTLANLLRANRVGLYWVRENVHLDLLSTTVRPTCAWCPRRMFEMGEDLPVLSPKKGPS